MAAFAKKPQPSLTLKKVPSCDEDLESKDQSLKLYISTMGYLYPQCEDGKFYPVGMPEIDRLRYYASKFNSIQIRTTFFGQPKTEVYHNWIQSVKDQEEFRFIINAPKLLSHSRSMKDAERAWTLFWDGDDHVGGCKLFHLAGKLGCILIEFPSTFSYTARHVGRIKALIPKDVRCAAEFRHWSWWESSGILQTVFSSSKNWCISTPYVENGLVESGWAGNLPSTRTQTSKESLIPVITTSFVFINLYGTMGQHLGSYDECSFLERLADRIKGYKSKNIDTVYCSFNNTYSSYCYPLPGVYIAGLLMRPKVKELPVHASGLDLPCGLHDAFRLGKLWKDLEECPYLIDKDGKIEMAFL